MAKCADSSTGALFQDAVIPVTETGNSLSVDCTGRYVCLGTRAGLCLFDLERPDEAYQILHDTKKWDIGLVSWNPHFSHHAYIASAANHRIKVWVLEHDSNPLQFNIRKHTRNISDLCWSKHDPNLFVSCSLDSHMHIWDLRSSSSPAQSFCAGSSAVTQVKWSPLNPMAIASAHNSEVCVWDIRKHKKSSAPSSLITAHKSILSLDWSPIKDTELLTSSQSGVKFWSTTNTRSCEYALETPYPVWRAKYSPFGKGFVTIAHSEDTALRLWSLSDDLTQRVHFVHAFVGHLDVIKAFDWRVIQQCNEQGFQLVSWSKDRTLRHWRIDSRYQEACGFGSGPEAPVMNKECVQEESTISSATLSSRKVPDYLEEIEAVVNRFNHRLLIEQSDRSSQTYIISVGDPLFPNYASLRLVVVFPESYPYQAPSFELLGSCTPELKEDINKSLLNIAQSSASTGRPCLVDWCEFLVSNIESLFRQSTSPSVFGVRKDGAADFLLDLKDEESGVFFGNHHDFHAISAAPEVSDEKLPCPRLCGAVFCGSNRLVFFNNFKFASSQANGFARTYAQLKRQIARIDRQSFVDMGIRMSGHGYPAEESMDITAHDSLLNGIDPSFENGLSLGMTGSGRTENAGDSYQLNLSPFFFPTPTTPSKDAERTSRTTSNRNNPPITVVVIKEYTMLMPFDLQLAHHYVLNGETAQLVCEKNAQVASRFGRSDLARAWSLAALCTSGADLSGRMSWKHSSVGGALALKLIAKYQELNDVQMVAMLSCVFAFPCLKGGVFRTKDEEESDCIFFASLHAYPASPATVINSALVSRLTEWHKLDEYRLMFAEFLYLEQQFTLRGIVLKFLCPVSRINISCSSSYPSDHQCTNECLYSTVLARNSAFSCGYEIIPCAMCGSTQGENDSTCVALHESTIPAHFSFPCAVCNVSTKGLAQFCFNCGHGGHVSHLQSWFKDNVECPAGCGCHCTS